jgi:phage repressor protein C with HTH and peptisase S24 domain
MASTRGERLRAARKKRYHSARAAAAALGLPASTYGAHERAEAPGGRDYGPDEAKRYARRFATTPEWLLTGRGQAPAEASFADETEAPTRPKVRVVGYVGAGAEAHLYAVAQGDLDEVEWPREVLGPMVAVEIRGDSLGTFFNHWLVFYDDVRDPVTPDLIGELCVVGLADGRILIKQLQPGRSAGRFNLNSQTEAPIRDVAINWAAKVKSMAQR